MYKYCNYNPNTRRLTRVNANKYICTINDNGHKSRFYPKINANNTNERMHKNRRTKFMYTD